LGVYGCVTHWKRVGGGVGGEIGIAGYGGERMRSASFKEDGTSGSVYGIGVGHELGLLGGYGGQVSSDWNI
jgi:hypothetical protein